jgi:hypothetical protein
LVSGTGHGFKIAPLRKHKRWWQLLLDKDGQLMKKWILIIIYLGIWLLIIPGNLPGFIIYDKSRFILLGFFGVLAIGLPYILYYILTEFEITQKTRKGIAYGSIFLLVPYGLWTGKIDDKRLSENNKQTKGIVYDKWTTKRKPLLKAKFKVDNKEYVTFSKTDYNDIFSIGDTVTIIYWTENPELSKIKELEK